LDQQGNLVSANLSRGINEQTKNLQSFNGAMLNKDLISMLKEEIDHLRKEGRIKEANELEGIVNHLSNFSPNATFLVQIEKDPNTGRLAHFSAQAGGDFKRFVFAGNKVYAESELALDPKKHPEDKKFLLELASAIEKFSPNVAKALREYANKGVPVQLAYQSTLDGTITSLTINSGGHARSVDLRQLTKGSLTEIYNLIQELSGRYSKKYHNRREHLYGEDFGFADDLLYAIIYNDPTVLFKNYPDAFIGNAPNRMGTALIDYVARKLGGYGRMAESIKEALLYQLEAGVDLSKSIIGKVLGIEMGASIAKQKQVVSQLDANTLALRLQKSYADTMRMNISSREKMRLFTNIMHEMYKAFEEGLNKDKFSKLVGVKKDIIDPLIPFNLMP
ncbi:MAG: hypothetical protein ACP5PT_08625, partial [Brevinematia bacterium]